MASRLLQLSEKYKQLLIGIIFVTILGTICLVAIYLPYEQACQVFLNQSSSSDDGQQYDIVPIVSKDLNAIATFRGKLKFPLDNYYLPLEIRILEFEQQILIEQTLYKLHLFNYCAHLSLSFAQNNNETQLIPLDIVLDQVHCRGGTKMFCQSDQLDAGFDMSQHFLCKRFTIQCQDEYQTSRIQVDELEFEILGNRKRIARRDFSKPTHKCET